MQETFSIATILNLNQSLNNFTTKGKCTIELNNSYQSTPIIIKQLPHPHFEICYIRLQTLSSTVSSVSLDKFNI